MKTKFFNGKEVTNEQFSILSLLAYECRFVADNLQDEIRKQARINCAMFACTLVNVPEELKWQVQYYDNCKGLQNLNRIASYERWEY